MHLSPWLDAIRFRTRKNKYRRIKTLPPMLERLEVRTLLSISTLFVGDELRVTSDADDSIRISVTAGNVVVESAAPGGVFAPDPALPPVAAIDVGAIFVEGGPGNNNIDLSGVNSSDFNLGLSISIKGRNGNDTITGSADLDDMVEGGDGDDTILTQAGVNTIDAGDGNDSISAGLGNDVVIGGDGDDTISGDEGDDSILGGDGVDSIDGGVGDDTLRGGASADVINGGDGNDSLHGNSGTDLVHGDAGTDTLRGGADDDSLDGGDDDDFLIGQAGNDTLNGNTGNDILNGNDGNDSLLGADGDDALVGNAGDDILIGNFGDDTMHGGAGDDALFGDSDVPEGIDTGNDRMRGQGGNDTLVGGFGIDDEVGGTGNDEVRSTFTRELIPPPPPPPPSPDPPPPPPPAAGFPIQDLFPATSSGTGASLGTTTTLTFGTGDGSLILSNVDGDGSFLSSVFDPLGTVYGSGDPQFISDIQFRLALTGTRTTLLNSGGAVMTGTATEARSSWSQSGLDWGLVQTVDNLDDGDAQRIGSLLTQTYSITNPGTTTIILDLVRYTDFHLRVYPNVMNDGGGRIFDSLGTGVFFESTNTVVPGVEVAFVGVTGIGGDTLTSDIFHLADLFVVDPNGPPLPDLIEGDTDGDDLVDMPTFDNRIALRNVYTLAPGQTADYTTHTAFGTFIPIIINQPPVAVDDTAAVTGSVPLTLDIVSNDSDPDGVLDFSSITITTPPTNGTVVDLGNGLVTYTPDPDFDGVDSFQYTIADDDGDVSAPATVTITVTAILRDDLGDTLRGSEGNDTVVGAFGDDFMTGGVMNDQLDGFEGNDTIFGGANDDTLNGGEGDDQLLGQAGDDIVNGNEDNDTLIWRGEADGNDTLDGGDGANVGEVRGNEEDNVFDVTQLLTLTPGGVDITDTVLQVAEGVSTVTLTRTFPVVIINGRGGEDNITLGDLDFLPAIALTVNGHNGADRIDAGGSELGLIRMIIDGGGNDDDLTGSRSSETILGGNGDDLIQAGSGDDLVNGGAGDDVIDGEDGNDNLDGDLGNDTIVGGNGDDSLTGNDDNDSLDGDAGMDTLVGGDGNDTLHGGADDDLVQGGIDNDKLFGGNGNDTLDGGRNDDTIKGQMGDDVLIGGHGDDILEGDDGDDTLSGGDGDDQLSGDNGNDGLTGGDGADLLTGSDGADTLVGGNGPDTLRGGADADILVGGDGDDVLKGQGHSADTLSGGEGNDRFDPADGPNERIEDFMLSAAILDSLDVM